MKRTRTNYRFVPNGRTQPAGFASTPSLRRVRLCAPATRRATQLGGDGSGGTNVWSIASSARKAAFSGQRAWVHHNVTLIKRGNVLHRGRSAFNSSNRRTERWGARHGHVLHAQATSHIETHRTKAY